MPELAGDINCYLLNLPQIFADNPNKSPRHGSRVADPVVVDRMIRQMTGFRTFVRAISVLELAVGLPDRVNCPRGQTERRKRMRRKKGKQRTESAGSVTPSTDLDVMLNFIDKHFCYFDQKRTDWHAVKVHYRRLVEAVRDSYEFIRLLEQMLDELYDSHTHLNVHLADSWRLPAHDIWATWKGGRAHVEEVRTSSDAAFAGVRAGHEILCVDGLPIRKAVGLRLPHFLRRRDSAAEQWALLSILSGRWNRSRNLVVQEREGRVRSIRIQNRRMQRRNSELILNYLIRGRRVGYIRISSFHDKRLISEFDRALTDLRKTSGLIIDVRDSKGGDMAIAKRIMGRLIRKKTQYAWMARRRGDSLGKRWREYILPRGRWIYAEPVVVLVNHWTQSTAEGFAVGLDSLDRAKVVGTRMAGLGAGITRVKLPKSGISVQVSSEPVYHFNGFERSSFVPSPEVNLGSAIAEKFVDPILAKGIAILDNCISS